MKLLSSVSLNFLNCFLNLTLCELMVVFGIELWWFLMHMLLCFPQFGVIWLLWQFSANPVDWYLVFWAFPFTSLLRFTFDNLDSVVRTHCWAWKVLFMRFGFLVSRTVRNLLPSAKGHLVLRHFFLRLLSNYAATLKNCCFYIPKTLNFVSYFSICVQYITSYPSGQVLWSPMSEHWTGVPVDGKSKALPLGQSWGPGRAEKLVCDF